MKKETEHFVREDAKNIIFEGREEKRREEKRREADEPGLNLLVLSHPTFVVLVSFSPLLFLLNLLPLPQVYCQLLTLLFFVSCGSFAEIDSCP